MSATPASTEQKVRRRAARRGRAVSVVVRGHRRARARRSASIRAHSFRSFLTTLGIVIGVASVIAMVSIIQGLSVTIGQQFQGLGSNGVTMLVVHVARELSRRAASRGSRRPTTT